MRRITSVARAILTMAVLGGAGGLFNPGTPHGSTIVFFGDSLTKGELASSPEHAFTSILRQRLMERGITGDDQVLSAFGGLFADLRLSQDIGRRPHSLIVVELGAHSVIDDLSLTNYAYGVGYGLMLDCLQSTGARVVVGTVPWLAWEPDDKLYKRAEEFSAINRAEAEKRGIPVADIWSLMLDRPELVAEDDFHPNDEGHRIVADAYWQAITVALQRPRGNFRYDCDYNAKLKQFASVPP